MLLLVLLVVSLALGEVIKLRAAECSDGTQTDYRGTVSMTRKGLECQRWDSQSPKEHEWTPGRYPNSGLEGHNYCRNPTADKVNVRTEQVWCLAIKPGISWQRCDVPNCESTEVPDVGNEVVDCSTVLLFDTDSQCESWAQLGYCLADSVYYSNMLAQCPSVCAGCSYNPLNNLEPCMMLSDLMEDCRMWQMLGYCGLYSPNYVYMIEHCAYTCHGCNPDLYEDGKCAGLVDNSRKCRKWAGEGLCQSAEFSGYMTENCAYSCQGCIKEVCTVAQDKRGNCASYYSSGWCEPSHAYYREIIQDCQYTCNDCVSL